MARLSNSRLDELCDYATGYDVFNEDTPPCAGDTITGPMTESLGVQISVLRELQRYRASDPSSDYKMREVDEED